MTANLFQSLKQLEQASSKKATARMTMRLSVSKTTTDPRTNLNLTFCHRRHFKPDILIFIFLIVS